MMDEKANEKEMVHLLDSKAGKESVKNALQRKISKSDFDTEMTKKPDIMEIENIISILETKAD